METVVYRKSFHLMVAGGSLDRITAIPHFPQAKDGMVVESNLPIVFPVDARAMLASLVNLSNHGTAHF